MAAPREQLLTLLAPYSPRLLDASARGSGWNSVWLLTAGERQMVLKVYGRRRTRVREWMTDFSHLTSGRTGYTARARRETEARCLLLWSQAGFDVPALQMTPPDFPPLPVPFLLMEFIPGPPLSRLLADPGTPQTAREAVFRRYLVELSTRHAAALERQEAAFLQEHPALDHVLVSDNRLVTFDLEVAYTTRHGIDGCVTAEIAGLIRSLFKALPAEEAGRYLQLMVESYPVRSRLERVHGDLFENPSPFKRAMHALDRARSKGRFDKYAAAVLLRDALAARPSDPV